LIALAANATMTAAPRFCAAMADDGWMTTHNETRIIAAPRETVFDLVADVERYPEFLPLWTDVRVFRRRGTVYYTEQEVGLGPVRQRFHTRTELVRPERIEVTSSDRNFRDFRINWDFAKAPAGCTVHIALHWQVRSWLLQRGIDMVLPETAITMVDAFERRARQTILAAGSVS
jgi:coenzyme Q-binding protein COQ10